MCLLWHKVNTRVFYQIVFVQILSTYLQDDIRHRKCTAFLCTLPSSCNLLRCGTPNACECICLVCKNSFLACSWSQRRYIIMTCLCLLAGTVRIFVALGVKDVTNRSASSKVAPFWKKVCRFFQMGEYYLCKTLNESFTHCGFSYGLLRGHSGLNWHLSTSVLEYVCFWVCPVPFFLVEYVCFWA